MSKETLITSYGVVAVTFMMTMYAQERRHLVQGGLPS